MLNFYFERKYHFVNLKKGIQTCLNILNYSIYS